MSGQSGAQLNWHDPGNSHRLARPGGRIPKPPLDAGTRVLYYLYNTDSGVLHRAPTA